MSLAQVLHQVMEETQFLPVAEVSSTVEQLTEAEHAEVLSFLAENPVHTVCMAGIIRDNGLESEHNRGTFWGCRNSEGRLEGVALIGHHTLIEARTRRAAREFALMVKNGMTPAQALLSATKSGADLLGLADQIGTIETGKLADLVAVPGDPLQDIRQTEKVSFVMQGGKVVKNPAGH